MGDVEFEGVGGGELRRVSQAWFMKLGKAGMDKFGMVCKIVMLGSEVFPAETVAKGGHIINKVEVINVGFRGEREMIRDDREFGSSERLGGEVKEKMDQIDSLGISVWRGRFKFLGRVAGM